MRRAFTALLACLPTCLAAVAGNAADPRPNILFIYTDDQSYRTVSCYPEADAFAHTPNIDALAASGVRFRYGYTGTWCMPSRATLLTGLQQHAVESMRMEGPYPGSEYDAERCPMWPAVFRQHGYQTAQIGKWHTGTDTGHGRDWDFQLVWNRPRHTDNAGSYYKDQLIERNGAPAERVTGYSTDNYTAWAVDYLEGEGRDPEKPWYLWLCYGAVHGPYTPAERHRDDFPDAGVSEPPGIYPPRPDKPAHLRESSAWVPGPDGRPAQKGAKGGGPGKSLDAMVRQYHQAVRALDEAVGTLMEALRRTGQYENTLVVFTSDQGFAWGQHGLRQKVAPYDASIRCPFIVAMPSRLPQGKVSGAPVGGADLIPTFFRFAGIELPWKMHGEDLTPLLKAPESARREQPLLTVHTGKYYGSDTATIPAETNKLTETAGIPWYASIHDGRFKYVRYFVKGEVEELYDLEEDPDEISNLALVPQHRERLATMRQETLAALDRSDAPYLANLPPVGGDE
jgi:arylsulfatase A-like enzyme